MSSRFATMFMGGALATLCLASPALASTIPFTSASSLALYPNSIDLYQVENTGYNPVIHTGAPPAAGSQSTNVSGAWGSASAYASADLQTGQLKARAAATATDYEGFTPYVQANATFGDGFTTTTNGSPFVWQSNSTAQFTLNLDGSASSSYVFDQFSPAVFVVLNIMKHGTLDPAAFSNSSYDITADPNILSTFVYVMGNTDFGLYFNGKPLTTTQAFTGIPSHITQAFNPGQDFDWWLLLGAAGQVPTANSFDLDLSHTLTLNYLAPAGTTTISASGLFENFESPTAAPEPATLVLLGTGLVTAAARRRLKKRA